MADTLHHRFVSAKAQSPDTTIVSKNEWNDTHQFDGGTNGEYIQYDDTQAGHYTTDNIWSRMGAIDITLPPYSVDKTGVVDCAAAVQSAVNTNKPVYFPIGDYKINSTINLTRDSILLGDYRYNALHRPNINFAASIIGIQTPSTDPATEICGILIKGLHFDGGAIQLNVPNGAVGLSIKDTKFHAPTDKCIHAQAFNQEWFFDNVECEGGNYGIHITETVGTSGAPSLLDKCNFKDLYIHQQAVNGILVRVAVSTTVVWNKLVVIRAAQDGMVIDGSIRNWTFIETNNEGNGYTGTARTLATTGSITTGTPTLTVASATGFAIGNTLTVHGAGVNGADLYSVINNIVGTVITLANNASTTRFTVDVTKQLYSDLKVTATIANSSGLTFIGGAYGNENNPTVAGLRYGIDLAGCISAGFFNTASSLRPIYDPNCGASAICYFNSCFVRHPEPGVGETFGGILLGVQSPRSMIISPNGYPLVLALRDNNGAGTGLFNNIEAWKWDSNRTRFWYIEPAGRTSNMGGMSPGGFSSGAGATLDHTSQRIVFGNVAPTAGAWIRGDVCHNILPAVGQPIGWLCTVSGTPGTWVAMANL